MGIVLKERNYYERTPQPMAHQQKLFNPVDYCFEWIYGWYTWNSKAAHTIARSARDQLAKELKQQGYTAHRFAIRNQLITRGGIGSGHPEVSFYVTVYGVNYRKDQSLSWTPIVVHTHSLERPN